jgi:hypothetical protein
MEIARAFHLWHKRTMNYTTRDRCQDQFQVYNMRYITATLKVSTSSDRETERLKSTVRLETMFEFRRMRDGHCVGLGLDVIVDQRAWSA